MLTARDLEKAGYINGIISGFKEGEDFFDPNIVPAIPKLMKAEVSSLTNAMQLLIEGKGIDRIEEVIKNEAEALVNSYFQPAFFVKMQAYQESIKKKKKEAKL